MVAFAGLMIATYGHMAGIIVRVRIACGEMSEHRQVARCVAFTLCGEGLDYFGAQVGGEALE